MPPRARAGDAPRAFLFWGQEETRKRAAVEELIESRLTAEDRALDLQVVDATDAGVTGEAILDALRDRGMFSEHRVVLVQNAGRLRSPRHQRTLEVLAAGIANLPEFATLILVAEAEDSAERARRAPFDEPLMAAMKSHGLVRQFALLKPEEMVQLAVREAASCEKRLPTSVAALLVERTGTDSLRLINEVRKLASYVGDRAGITAQDVDLMLAPPLDNNVWHLLEAAFSGQGNRALGLLRQLIESGTSVHQILPLLARTLRNLAQAKLLDEHGIPAAAERESLSTELLAALPPDGGIYVGSNAWQRGRLWNQAKRFDWSQIHRAIDRLALVEAGLKGWERGIEDEHLALEVFLLELLGSRPVRSSR